MSVAFAQPLTAILIPLIGAIGIVACRRLPNLREGTTLVTSLLLFACVCGMLPIVLAPDFAIATAESVGYSLLPGMRLAFTIEPLGMVYAMIAATLWPLNSLYSIGYMRGNNEQHQTRFYLCFALALSAAMGIAFADNMFTLFVFYEALTISTFPLVSHKGTPDAVRSARTYLGILVSSSICFLLSGMIGAYLCSAVPTADGQMRQTLDFTIGGIFQGDINPFTIGILFALHIYGIGKCAIMPLHRWLPAAMVAPTPVSALLHAVAVVKAGVFSVVKVTVYIFGVDTLARIGWADWLVYVSGFTIVCASFIALFQDNLKRRLAYSTISQLSYIVMGAAMFTPVAIVGAGMHIAAHAFGKITLFFAAGSIYTAAHKTKVSELDGIGRRMPWTMAAFTVGTLSMIGLPLTGGIVSKWFLLQGALTIQSGFVVVVLTLSTLLNAWYFLPIVHRAFFRHEVAHDPHHGEGHEHGEAPWPIVVALSCTALFTIALFFWPDLYLTLMGLVQAACGGAP